jgi:hypothetical protein
MIIYLSFFSDMKKYFAAIFFLLISISATAQNTASSPYSVYGIGTIHEKSSSLSRELSGTGIAVQDGFNLNPVNPASYVWMRSPLNAVFEVTAFGERNRYQTIAAASVNGTGGLGNINLWLKPKPWWGASFGIAPFSSVSYNIASTKELGTLSHADYIYSGNGNVSQLYLGNSFRLTRGLSAGLHISYLFGSVNKTETVVSASSGSSLSLNDKIVTRKAILDYGIQYSKNLDDRRSLTIGAVYSGSSSLKSTSEITLSSGGDTLANYAGDEGKFNLPSKAGLGLALHTRSSILAFDLVTRSWAKAKYASSGAAFSDTWRYSVGYSFLGSEKATGYFGSLTFSVGAFYENHYLQLKGNQLSNYGFSAGVGLPVMDGKSTVKLAYSFDRFGTLDNNLILQRSDRISLGIVIRDVWGYKRKFD